MKNKKNAFYLIVVLGLLTAIGPLSIDMYLPAFPEIAESLDTDISHVMLSLSSFFVGISVGQLLYGPLLERFGRKKPLYIGLAAYLLATVGCAFAASVNVLILFRLLQALGGCAGMVAARAIVRDLFDVKQNARIFSILMLVVAVSPIIAPTFGGYITASLGWRYVFAMLIFINLVIIAGVYLFLPESKTPDPGFSLKAPAIIKNFITIIRHPQFYTYAFSGAFAYGGLTAYVSGSPSIFMGLFHVTEKQFGWIFALIAIGIISASQVNTLVLRKSSSEGIIRVATLLQTAVGLSLAAVAFWQINELYLTIFLIFLFVSCQGFIFPNASALSLAPFGYTAGTASALMGAVQMGIGAMSSALVSVFQNGTALPMSAVMSICSLTACCLYFLGRKIIIRKATEAAIEQEEIEMIARL